MGIVKERRTSNNGVLVKNVDVYTIEEKLFNDAIKQDNIDTLTVVTTMGTWKADEKSQDRMSNAIAQLSRKPFDTTKKWKMFDKSKVDVVQADIEEAFDLAVAELDAIVMA